MAYLVALVWITLSPSGDGQRVNSLLYRLVDLFQSYGATRWLDYDSVEFAANILLFVPMGVFVVLLFGRRLWWAGIFAGVLASCWIELAQAIWFTDRVSDPRDLASNSIGTVVGVVLALLVTWPAAYRLRVRADARSASHAEA